MDASCETPLIARIFAALSQSSGCSLAGTNVMMPKDRVVFVRWVGMRPCPQVTQDLWAEFVTECSTNDSTSCLGRSHHRAGEFYFHCGRRDAGESPRGRVPRAPRSAGWHRSRRVGSE